MNDTVTGEARRRQTAALTANDKELDILERIYRGQPNVRQRDLARVIGLSLGMTNSIVKRLAEKGLLKIRKINNRNIQYIVSPQGIEEIARRSYRYFRRTIKNVVYYKEAVERFVRELKRQGIRQLLLVGASDLEFIVEHACDKAALAYRRVGPEEIEAATDGSFLLFAESFTGPASAERSAHLDRILTKPQRIAPEEAP